nr:MAG TPA: hypothetical protein [Caudoviricetes sp.]
MMDLTKNHTQIIQRPLWKEVVSLWLNATILTF